MNVRDPFNLRRSPAFAILRGTNVQTAAAVTRQLIETGAQKIVTSSRQLAEDVVETAQEVSEQVSKVSEQVSEQIEQMSFSIPKNVPSFDDPQRQMENHAWGASAGGVSLRGGASGSVQDRLGGYYERNKNYFSEESTNRDLPLYKDKPYYTAKAKRRQPLWRRRRVFALAGLFVMGVLYMLGIWGGSSKEDSDKPKKSSWSWTGGEKAGAKVDWTGRQKDVVTAFTQSWDAYERYAWGYDEFHPKSQNGKQMTPKGMGWIIVDALDTLMLMNLTSRLETARTWIDTKLDYDQDQEVNTFETTIRMIGGLLSAHYLSTEFPAMAPVANKKDDLYIEKAKDLADRVMGAFESKSGVPYASVNLHTFKGVFSHDDGGASSTAEAATLQLEFKYLSKLTGEVDYWEKAERVIKVLDNNGAQDGLVPIYVYAQTGTFRGDNIRLGSRGDSYYEYLIKQYLQTNEPIYKDMWNEALGGVRKHLITYSEPSGFTLLGERQGGLKGPLTPKMDHLVCFMPGTIALGATGGLTEREAKITGQWGVKQEADMKLARELMQTCWGMYKYMATGLAPEITHFNINTPHKEFDPEHKSPDDSIFEDQSSDAEWKKDFVVKQNDLHNLQRPETVESLFYMYRITGDEKYREWGWEMFRSFMNHTAVELGGGFTSLSNANVIPAQQRDNMESFWLAETLKYFYLLFGKNDVLPLDQVVINTEAHPFPRFKKEPLFKTGWERKPRDAEGKMIKRADEKTGAVQKVVTITTTETTTKAV